MSKAQLERRCREHADQVVARFITLLEHAEQEASSLRAGEDLLAYGYGKPNQPTSDETPRTEEYDYSRLTLDERRQLLELLARAKQPIPNNQ